jgi:hypothetical protein
MLSRTNETERRGYDTAQICRSGHIITAVARTHPQDRMKFCELCGAETITACEACNTFIRGADWDDSAVGQQYRRPSYCRECGKPYPWLADTLQAAAELADLTDDLDDKQRDDLKRSLDDLVSDTPRTEVAALRFKKAVSGLGKSAADGFKNILVDVLSETAKKTLWPSG